MRLATGARLGPYEIVAPLGSGGMGEVYRAHDTRLAREVAIKVISADYSADPQRLRRFEQEARAAARLSHPNILAVYDIGTHDGLPYVVSELLDGQTLEHHLARQPLETAALLDLAMQLADALATAHEHGIVHRDLKPSNVFVTSRGQVKVLDFGLAKIRSESGAAASAAESALTVDTLTSPGTALGTIAYMSPEQARGETVDERSDLFSAGVVLYEMATGQRPFGGSTSAVVFEAILNRMPTPPTHVNPRVAPELDRIIGRALEKDVHRRYQHARDLLADLRTTKRAIDAGSGPTSGAAARTPPSIAVLPFSDMSPQHDQEYFCEGLAEELINALTALAGLRVAARSSAFQFTGHAHDVKKVGEQLKVETVLEGSVRKAGNRLRITAQLIKVADGYHLWSERYDRDLDDVFAVQEEIARAIVEKLKVQLAGEQAIVKPHTADPEAYNLYLQGRYYWSRRGAGFLQQAIDCFERAIARDPSYALAHTGLADSYTVLGVFGVVPPGVALERARPAAERAIALDARLAEGHQALAFIRRMLDWNFREAERAYRIALDLKPGFALAHAQFGLMLASLGRIDEATAEVTRARAIEPLSGLVAYYSAAVHWFARRSEEALEECRRVNTLDPGLVASLWVESGILAQVGRMDEACQAADRAVTLSRRQTFFLGNAAWVQAAAGRRDAALSLVDELRDRSTREYVSPLHFADVATALGNLDEAFVWFERAYRERAPLLAIAATLPAYDSLRSDPRFGELLRKIGLPS